MSDIVNKDDFYLMKNLSQQLTSNFGKGFTATNLKMMRQFYNTFPNSHTLCSELSWSHYRLIIRLENKKAEIGKDIFKLSLRVEENE